ncbi:glycosyltransferase [candidate division WWE3 bacterium]|jgi:glycosyltransferase involved in cell wall biosynthesis|nr:glycosyltransferase [candidate division WWE3 bacterium]MBT7349465.1 glycosyltransferase [candidate division WWE3 bacterium]
MQKVDGVIFVHRSIFEGKRKKGGVDFVLDFFIEKGKKFLLIESPLEYSLESRTDISYLDSSSVNKITGFKTALNFAPLNWVVEIIVFIYASLRYGNKGNVCVAADPLAALGGVFLKKTNYFSFLYFHLTDYSEKRFPNIFLNFIYQTIFKIAIRNADLVGCVSSTSLGLVEDLNAKHALFVPNSRDFGADAQNRVSISERERFSLITIPAFVGERYRIYDLVKAIAGLKKKFPRVKLRVVGGLELEVAYVNKIKNLIDAEDLEENVEFVGFVSKEECTRLSSKSWLGVALFNEEDSFRKYSDSLKIREYASLGVPTITDTNASSSAEDVRKYRVGEVTSSSKGIQEAITMLFEDEIYYKRISENALNWAKKFDKRKIVEDLFERTFD